MGIDASTLTVGASTQRRLRGTARKVLLLTTVAVALFSVFIAIDGAYRRRVCREYDSFEPATVTELEHSQSAIRSARNRSAGFAWRTIEYAFVDREGHTRRGTHRIRASTTQTESLTEPFELRYSRADPSRVRVSWECTSDDREALSGSLGLTVLASACALWILGALIFLGVLVGAPLRKLRKIASNPLPLLAHIRSTRPDGKGRVLVEYEAPHGPQPIRGLQWFDAEGPDAPWFGDAQRTTIVALGAADANVLELLRQSGEPFGGPDAVRATLEAQRVDRAS